ncbi:MAG: hypothetical protein WCF19_08280 [Chlamydiales bacterium]
MNSILIYIHSSDQNGILDKVAALTREGDRIYNDEGGDCKAHRNTIVKFALLSITSPLIAMTRLVRSACFCARKDFQKAGREFIGALFTPLIATVCLIGSLLSSITYVMSGRQIAFYIGMRRTYAYFDAWINQINLRDPNLASYSQRVSPPMKSNRRIWTTAPCLQPLLENIYSKQGGLLDPKRMQKIFPFLQVKDVQLEEGKVVIQSQYASKKVVKVQAVLL